MDLTNPKLKFSKDEFIAMQRKIIGNIRIN